MRRLLGYVRPYNRLVLGALAFLFAEGALQLVGPFLTRRVIDVALPARDFGMVRTAALLYLGALVAQFICSYAETLLTSLLGQRVMRDLRLEIFGHLQRLSITFFDRNPVGRLITRVTSDVEALNEMFTAGVVAGLGDLFTLVAISIAMLVVDWRLAIASFLTIPLVILTSNIFRIRVRESYREIRVRLARINAFLQERIGGIRVVQLFGRERAEAARFDGLNREHLVAHLKSIRVYALYFPAIEILTSVALATLIVAGAARVEGNTLTVGTVALALQLVRRFFQPLQDLSEKYNILQGAMASSERIFTLLDTEPDAAQASALPASLVRGGADGSGQRTRDDAVSAAPSDGAPVAHLPRKNAAGVTIEFESVWFAYDLAHVARADRSVRDPEWVMRDVSFRVAPGETMAIVGHTGAGKTTIVSLLMRFYDPQRGRITMDGVDIRNVPLSELRGAIGYVQQDIFLFAGDVASNIRLSNPLPDAAVAEAAARVGADRVVQRLPQGYAHELGERGASISVGERQLLSFARAVAADPALLLLDEATSAVDSEIEADIQRALGELMRGRTTIAIAHRLSKIVGSDEILVLHHGRVAERGTHRALLARRGLYDRLYRLQVGESAVADRVSA